MQALPGQLPEGAPSEARTGRQDAEAIGIEARRGRDALAQLGACTKARPGGDRHVFDISAVSPPTGTPGGVRAYDFEAARIKLTNFAIGQ